MKRKSILVAAISLILSAGFAQAAEAPYIGKSTAKIELLEYAPVNCPPCQKTHDALMLKLKKFTDAGTVKYKFKALVAIPGSEAPALALECVKPENYYKLYDTLSATQELWTDKEKREIKLPQLKAASAKYLSDKEFDKCVGDKKLETQIKQSSVDAMKKYTMRSAPTFILNGERLLVAKDEDAVINAINLATQGKSANKIIEAKSKVVLAVNENDRVLGDAKAPVTIIEYASLSCPHCAHFHETVLPEIKKNFIDKGKVRLVFRDFPLNAPALKAGVLTRCVDKSKYQQLLATLFSTQADWVAAPDEFMPKLQKVAVANGVSLKEFQTCMANKKLEDEILKGYQDAASIGVESTPSFFINGQPAQGMHEPKTATDAINAALSAKKQ